MNITSTLKLIAKVSSNVKILSLRSIIILQEDSGGEEKFSMALVGPLAALIENTQDKMTMT